MIDNAIIHVEMINGPILLTSGRLDQIWPSETMANNIVTRLKANNSKFEVIHLNYEKCGHCIFGLFDSPDRLGFVETMGGKLEDNLKAVAQNWVSTLKFLNEHLNALNEN